MKTINVFVVLGQDTDSSAHVIGVFTSDAEANDFKENIKKTVRYGDKWL